MKYSTAKCKVEKEKKVLLLSQNQVVVTRMVVLEWLNFPKCLGIYPTEGVPGKLLCHGKKKPKFLLTCEKTACALALLLG